MQSTLEPDDIATSELRTISRAEYGQLIAQGFFIDENVELLRGLVVRMNAEGVEHAGTVEWLTKRFIRGLSDDYSVRPCLGFVTSDSQLQPDLCVGPTRAELFTHPESAFLMIEVSKTSIRKDRRVKQRIYAEVGVPEYWIIDITGATPVVEVYTEPSATGYDRMVKLRDGDVLRPSLLPIEFAVSDLPR